MFTKKTHINTVLSTGRCMLLHMVEWEQMALLKRRRPPGKWPSHVNFSNKISLARTKKHAISLILYVYNIYFFANLLGKLLALPTSPK